MFYKNCGAKLDKGVNFCKNCEKKKSSVNFKRDNSGKKIEFVMK